jgi:hypothetical protein
MKMSKQKEKINHLLSLIKDNPDLKIVPMVDNEVCGGNDYSTWCGSWGNARVDETYSSDERIYFRSIDDEDLVDKYADKLFYELFPNRMSLTDVESEIVDKKANEIVNNLNWEKVIVVSIGLP